MASSKKAPVVSISSSQRTLRVPRKRIARLVAHVAAAEGADLAEVDVAVVGGREMASLNRRYLGEAGATDVLSFDLGGAARAVQIVVCADVAVREARRRGLRRQHELLLYVVHGLLHVLGYDDARSADAAAMHARQAALLEEFLGTCRGRAPRRRR